MLQSRPALVEVRFLSWNTQAFFRVFGSCSKTIEMLTGRITVFIKQSSASAWSSDFLPSQINLLPLLPQRPSYHDLVFQCGSDSMTDNQTGVRYFVLCNLLVSWCFLSKLKNFHAWKNLEKMITQGNVWQVTSRVGQNDQKLFKLGYFSEWKRVLLLCERTGTD